MMETVVIQFSTSTAWQSGIIRKICHSPFSHVDVVMDGGCLGASDQGKDSPVLAGNPQGVAVRPHEYQEFGIRRRAVIRIPTADKQRFESLLRAELGKPFDGEALHAFLSTRTSIGRDWRDADKWFCSELVTWALEEAGFFNYDLAVSKDRVSPADLLLILNPAMANLDTFWQPVPDLKLGTHEE
jgi:hypothetical protein